VYLTETNNNPEEGKMKKLSFSKQPPKTQEKLRAFLAMYNERFATEYSMQHLMMCIRKNRGKLAVQWREYNANN